MSRNARKTAAETAPASPVQEQLTQSQEIELQVAFESVRDAIAYKLLESTERTKREPWDAYQRRAAELIAATPAQPGQSLDAYAAALAQAALAQIAEPAAEALTEKQPAASQDAANK